MKKVLLSLFLVFFNFSSIFADYIATENDKKIIKNSEIVLKNFSENKKNELKNKILKIINEKNLNSRSYFIVSEIYKIIWQNPENAEKSLEVLRIIDWDTLEFLENWVKIKARLLGIDAPESTTKRFWYVEKYWKEATEKLKEMIWNNKIFVKYDDSQDKIDKYWRHLVYVFINWKNIWEEMIKNWFAKEYTYKKDYKYQENFKNAQNFAKENFLWIWEKQGLNYDPNYKIKWNINKKEEKLYHYFPGCKSYEKTKIDLSKWEKYFSSINIFQA